MSAPPRDSGASPWAPVPIRLLRSTRLVLEPLTEGHAQVLFEALRDPALYWYVPQDPPPSMAALAQRYQSLEQRRSPDGQEIWLNWAARLGADGPYVGTFEATVYGNAAAHVAYCIFSAHWRRGFGKEGLVSAVHHLVRDFGVTYLMADIDTRNAASQALVASVGFRRGPVRRAADFYKGASVDEVRYIFDRRSDGADGEGELVIVPARREDA